MNQTLFRALLPLSLVCALGCEDSHAYGPSGYGVSSVEDGLLYTMPGDGEGATALLLDVAGEDPELTRLELPGGSASVFQRPGSDRREVLVLTSGLDAIIGGEDARAAVPSHVLLMSRAGQVADITLGNRYQSVSVSQDGRYVIAFAPIGLSFENSAEVVDLMTNQVTPLDLSNDGRPPTYFVFSPSPGFSRRFAVAPLPSALQVIDLEQPAMGAITIQLDLGQQPEELLFAGERIFVRGSSSAQIVVLESVPESSPRGYALAPTVLQARSAVRDIAVSGAGDGQRLLGLSDQLEVFDPRIGVTATIPGVGAFSEILQFEGSSPTNDVKLPRAMLYAIRGTTQVGFLDLGNEADWATRNVELVDLGESIITLQALSTPRAIAMHQARVSVIDLEQRTVRRVQLGGFAGSLLVDESASHARLWTRGGDGNQPLGVIDLNAFTTAQVPVALGTSGWASHEPSTPRHRAESVAPTGMMLVPSATRPRLAVLQSASSGRVTFLDANNPTAESALEVLGMFLSQQLD